MANKKATAPKATQFKPGQSGNPGGRKSHKAVRESIANMEPDALASLWEAIKDGEQWAVTLWFHYFHGKPLESVEHTGKDGEAVQVSVQIIRTVKGEPHADATQGRDGAPEEEDGEPGLGGP